MPPKQITFGVATCLWRRPHIARAMMRYYVRAGKVLEPHGIRIVGCAAGSEGATSERLARSAGFKYVEYSNKHLSTKWNAAVAQLRSCDAILVVGSDDWISHRMLLAYAKLIRQGVDYIGLLDQFFLHAKSRELIRFRGYNNHRKGEPVGIGRCLSRGLVSRLHGKLWPRGDRRGLDGLMTKRLSRATKISVIGEMQSFGHGCVAIDIKSSTNIWGIDQFRTRSSSCRTQWTATKHLERHDRLELDEAMQKDSAT